MADPNWPDKIGYVISRGTMLGSEWRNWPGEVICGSGVCRGSGGERELLCAFPCS